MNKKIGIDVRLWNETGIGRYIRNLISNLAVLDKAHTYVLFTQSKDLEKIKSFISNTQNFQIITTDIKWHSVAEQIEFPRLLNKYALDLMHFPYFSVPIFYNKPFVVTVHDLIINHFPTGQATTLPLPFYAVKRAGYSLIIKNAITKSKKIIVPTNVTKQEILDHYSVAESKVDVTPEGVDASILDFKPTVFKEKKPYFLYVGNAYPHKNLEKLLDAFRIFSEKHPDYKLRIAGKRDFFSSRLFKNNNNSNIEFLGYVSDIELAKLYKQSQATFVPSLMEGFGLTALEAMSMGSVVACSKISSLQEVCGDNVFYFDPGDVLSVVSTMEKIKGLEKKQKEEMIRKGREHVKTFSWEKMTKETIDVYSSCL